VGSGVERDQSGFHFFLSFADGYAGANLDGSADNTGAYATLAGKPATATNNANRQIGQCHLAYIFHQHNAISVMLEENQQCPRTAR
jgi:hypothetical protein